jgi:UPF0716 protein FxsA
MIRIPFFGAALFSWLALELAAFLIVAQAVGFVGALLIGLATSLAGAVVLRQTGLGALAQIRASFDGAPQRPGAMVDGWIRAFAGVLLVIPGFLTDLAGLALAAPSVRQMLARRFGGAPAFTSAPRRGRPATLDLDPEEWSSLDRQGEAARR